MMKYLKGWATQTNWGTEFQKNQFERFKSRMKGLLYLIISVFLISIFGVANETTNWGIGKSPSFVDSSVYISINASATSNTFLLKEVTSEFSVGNIVTIGDSKKEHEITKVTALNKS